MSFGLERSTSDLHQEFRRKPNIDEQAGQKGYPNFIESKFLLLAHFNGEEINKISPGNPAVDILFDRFTDVTSELSVDWDENTSISFGRIKTAFVSDAINDMSWVRQRSILEYFWQGYQEFYCTGPNEVVLSDIEFITLCKISSRINRFIDVNQRVFTFNPEGKALMTYEQILETYPAGVNLPDARYGEPLLFEEAVEHRKFLKAKSFYDRIGEWMDADFLYLPDQRAMEKLREKYTAHAANDYYGGEAQPELKLNYLWQVLEFHNEFEKSEGKNIHHDRIDQLLFIAGHGGTIKT